MITRITDFIFRLTSLKTLIIFIAAVIIIEIGFSLYMPEFTEKTGGALLDMSAGYSSEFAYERLSTFGMAAGAYLKIRIIDFIFPAVYAFALSVLSCFVYRRKYDSIGNYRWVLMVPFLAAFFDYMENIIIVILFRSLPAQFFAAASILNVVTILKFGLLALSILLFITGGLALLKGSDSMLLMGNKFKGDKKEK